jgi:superfamily I DNA and/or RNA helicase
MITKCPYCEQPLKITDTLKSGRYKCPYDNCLKVFFFDKDAVSLYKTEENNLGLIGIEKGIEKSINNLIAEFEIALEDEIKAVKTRGGDRVLYLKNGKFITEITGERVFQFNIERNIPVIDETPAQITIFGKNYRATIIRFLESKLEIRIVGFDGEEISAAELRIDATYILKKLKKALLSLNFNPQDNILALKTFNFLPVKCKQNLPNFILKNENGKELDSYQEDAMRSCLGNEVAFVHGPPGTGKTLTLVNVVNDIACNGYKVLVTCHTNIACDNIIEQFINYYHEKTIKNLLDNGKIIRIGTPILSKVKEFTLETLYQRLSEELIKEKEELSNKKSELLIIYQDYNQYKQAFFKKEQIKERINNSKGNINSIKENINEHLLNENYYDSIISKNEKLLSIAKKRNVVINFFKKTMPKHLRVVIHDSQVEKDKIKKKRLEEEEKLDLLLNELDKLNESLNFLMSEKLNSLPKDLELEKIENVLTKIEDSLKEINIKITNIDDKISELNKGLLENARILVSTLSKTFIDPVLMNRKFDVVVVDEASIAPLPMLFYICSLAKKKVLIFGDPKQLSPIKIADTIIAKKWLSKDIFQQAKATEATKEDQRIKVLNNQYRMHKEIFEIINNYFYSKYLNDKRPEIDQEYNKYNLKLIPKSEHRVIIIDTSNANSCMSLERTGPKSNSRYNLYHILIIEKLLHDLIESKYIKQEEIGIITPYRSQISFIREVLREYGFNNIDIGVVHSFQGIEKKYIIFDLVEAPIGRKIGVLVNDKHERYLEKDKSENAALRLLTVAFSRPKEKLTIISHNEHMLSKLPNDSVLRKIIYDLVKSNSVVDGSNLVPYYVPKDEDSEVTLFDTKELLNKEAILNQRSFYSYLIRDLENAKKEVIFISGYMSTSRIERLLPHFNYILSKGVNIKIFTKPPREQMSREEELEEIHCDLRNRGIEIFQHYGTHEKIVIIDNHILYAGSLNVLSFNNSSKEMMIRTDSEIKTKKMFSVLSKNYPKLKQYLSKDRQQGETEQPIDLTPEKFRNVLDIIRPKSKKFPKNKQEAQEYFVGMFTKLRWVIADDKRIPYFAVLYNKTIRSLINSPPKNIEELLLLPEFIRSRSNIGGYEKIILDILKEYTEIISNK